MRTAVMGRPCPEIPIVNSLICGNGRAVAVLGSTNDSATMAVMISDRIGAIISKPRDDHKFNKI